MNGDSRVDVYFNSILKISTGWCVGSDYWMSRSIDV